ncbi:MAG: hypothetical protein JXR23_04055 [Pontiellaceae bacterium]|nr:hypothetical protein [Pontiellaceae bacterium]
MTELPGPGEATPAICDGVIYLSGYESSGKTLFAMQINAADGTVLWKMPVASCDKLPSRNVIAIECYFLAAREHKEREKEGAMVFCVPCAPSL